MTKRSDGCLTGPLAPYAAGFKEELIRLGYSEQAAELARRLGDAVTAGGLREYYDPYTGRGMGAPSFAWSTLLVEMLDRPDPGHGTAAAGQLT